MQFNYKPTPTGWVCPKCGNVYAPTTPMCFKCSNSSGNEKSAALPEKTVDAKAAKKLSEDEILQHRLFGAYQALSELEHNPKSKHAMHIRIDYAMSIVLHKLERLKKKQ